MPMEAILSRLLYLRGIELDGHRRLKKEAAHREMKTEEGGRPPVHSPRLSRGLRDGFKNTGLLESGKFCFALAKIDEILL